MSAAEDGARRRIFPAAYLQAHGENPCTVVAAAAEATLLKIRAAYQISSGQSETLLEKRPTWPRPLSKNVDGCQVGDFLSIACSLVRLFSSCTGWKCGDASNSCLTVVLFLLGFCF